MQVPTIHSNGTPRDTLVQGLCDGGVALMEAMKIIGENCPNGRDYYPQGPEAFRRATAEHDARLAKLREVYKELVALAEAIDGVTVKCSE